ncbi:MAG: NAD(P)H-dependent oxidoreductase subunit E, partial [Candidatus Omnitrophica bacterium]|nr:NAD(P)H-dependent oxidoreductase subunit E [Candidatus Omnitrophota bacterium]
YEQKRAAMLPVLALVQEHYGYISPEAEQAVAEYFGTTPVHIHEVVTFYELFRTHPEGKHQIRFCRTLSCTLLGGVRAQKYLEEKLGIKPGETTKDGTWTLHEAECLGACEIAPMMQVDGDNYGPLDERKMDTILSSVVSRESSEKKP